MNVSLESSMVGLAIQWVGVILVTTLSFLLTRSLRRPFLDYWTIAWTCLTVALSAQLLAISLPRTPRVFYTVYFLGEYAFCYLFIAGCRNLAVGTVLSARDRWALPQGALIAGILPHFSSTLSVLLVPHYALLSGFWATAFLALRPARQRKQRGPGIWVLSAALIVMTIHHFHYVPVFAYASMTQPIPPFPYLKYHALYDLLLQIWLAFGTIMVVLESVRRELEEANHELTATSARLQILAERDPLTGALNRHAFCALFREPPASATESPTGTVVVIDVDRLKTVNDTLGHAAGDEALQEVARVLRGMVHSDDLLFRWGGDEFLLIMPNYLGADLATRFEHANEQLAKYSQPLLEDFGELGISYGTAHYGPDRSLEQAIEDADRAMYAHKQSRKAAQKRPESVAELIGIS